MEFFFLDLGFGSFATKNPFPRNCLGLGREANFPRQFWVGVGTLVKSSEVYVGEGGVVLRLPGKHLSR